VSNSSRQNSLFSMLAWQSCALCATRTLTLQVTIHFVSKTQLGNFYTGRKGCLEGCYGDVCCEMFTNPYHQLENDMFAFLGAWRIQKRICWYYTVSKIFENISFGFRTTTVLTFEVFGGDVLIRPRYCGKERPSLLYGIAGQYDPNSIFQTSYFVDSTFPSLLQPKKSNKPSTEEITFTGKL